VDRPAQPDETAQGRAHRRAPSVTPHFVRRATSPVSLRYTVEERPLLRPAFATA
jgi:hypothetical protein